MKNRQAQRRSVPYWLDLKEDYIPDEETPSTRLHLRALTTNDQPLSEQEILNVGGLGTHHQ
jgi:hypothetical protein